MKKFTLATMIALFLMGSTVLAEELKNNDETKDLSNQVIETSKSSEAKVTVKSEDNEPKRPFHYVGRSEN